MLILLALVGCKTTPRALAGAPMPPEGGLEGFYPAEAVTAQFLERRAIPVDEDTVQRVLPLVGKLVLHQGPRTSPEAELLAEHAAYCSAPRVRAFNERKCRALEERTCTGGACTYEAYGNCSGLFAGPGVFVTAAHCTAGMGPEALAQSQILAFALGPRGWRAEAFVPGEVDALKRSWEDAWVVLEPAADDRMDVARIRFEGAGPAAVPVSPHAPEAGAALFLAGYPRSGARSPSARERWGYEPVSGTLSLSFGSVRDPNPDGHALCSTTGAQDDWRISGACPTDPTGGVDGAPLGPVSFAAFTSSVDTINGYSGGPVFDARGRWVGINCTVYGADPREGYVEAMTAVHTRASDAMEALGP